MIDKKPIEILRLHSQFLDRNKELVLAIRDKKPREVIAAIFEEIRHVYILLSSQNVDCLFGRSA